MDVVRLQAGQLSDGSTSTIEPTTFELPKEYLWAEEEAEP